MSEVATKREGKPPVRPLRSGTATRWEPEACPDDDALATFAQGIAEGEEKARLEEHVRSCESCGAILETLTETYGGPTSRRAAGRYELVSPLGQGGMGVVYEARDPVLNRRIAVKLLHRGRQGKEEETRLLREAQAMARVAHPSVVTVYDAGIEDGRVFLAMELVRGPSLRQHLAEKPNMPFEARLALMRAAGKGLAAAHEANVVHRDFKPENILVGASGARVTDFGLARPGRTTLDEESPKSSDARWIKDAATRGVHGTPPYMSPEQLDGAELDARTDQWSFGVTLYEVAYRAHPFGLWGPNAPATLEELRRAMDRGPLPPPPNADAPAWIRPVIERALAIRPEDRWADMTELTKRLEGPEPESPEVTTHLRRLGIGLIVMAGLHLTMIVVFVGALMYPDDAPAQKEGATFLEIWGGAILAFWGPGGAVLAPLSAHGLSQRRWWALPLTFLYGFSALATGIGTPIGILAMYTLSRRSVRAALAKH